MIKNLKGDTMDLKYLIDQINRIMNERLKNGYTGKIIITVNCNAGGIGNAQVNCNFNIEKPGKVENKLKSDY